MSAINERVSDLIEKFTSDDMAALLRFVECCEDPDAGGHDVEKSTITRLSQYGALRQVRPGYHEVTEFGEFILNGGIDELQQYRAAAEPVVSDSMALAFHAAITDSDAGADDIEEIKTGLRAALANYAAPQVTSVPEEATPESIEVLASVSPPHGVAFQLDGYERKLASDIWNACRGAMLTGEGETAAPAVQAEPLSVDTLTNVLRNAPVAPSDSQGKKRGNSPTIPDGSEDMLRRWLSFGKGMQKAGSHLPRHLIAETEAMLPAAPKQEAE